VVEVRNNVAHATGGIPTDKFEEMWNVLVASMEALDRNTSGLSKLRETPLVVRVIYFLNYGEGGRVTVGKLLQ
jgi:hypothetical protein